VHVILVDIHQPGANALVLTLQVREVPEHAFELSDAVVPELVLGSMVVVDEPLQQQLIAQRHIHKRLIQVFIIQLPSVEIEVE